MKKVVLAVVMLVAVASASQAQGIRLGVKAGGNLTKISGVSFSDGFDFSYHAGGFLEIDFNKKWGIQPEVLFSQTATKPSSFKTVYTTASNPAITGDDRVKLNYLSIPLLLRYNVGSILSLNAGPQYSILLNNNRTLLQNGQDAFKDGDFALVAGAQINLKYLRVYGRYNIGLQNINDIDSKDKWTNQQIQLGLGLRF